MINCAIADPAGITVSIVSFEFLGNCSREKLALANAKSHQRE
jgi:hypothetical protein